MWILTLRDTEFWKNSKIPNQWFVTSKQYCYKLFPCKSPGAEVKKKNAFNSPNLLETPPTPQPAPELNCAWRPSTRSGHVVRTPLLPGRRGSRGRPPLLIPQSAGREGPSICPGSSCLFIWQLLVRRRRRRRRQAPSKMALRPGTGAGGGGAAGAGAGAAGGGRWVWRAGSGPASQPTAFPAPRGRAGPRSGQGSGGYGYFPRSDPFSFETGLREKGRPPGPRPRGREEAGLLTPVFQAQGHRLLEPRGEPRRGGSADWAGDTRNPDASLLALAGSEVTRDFSARAFRAWQGML